MKNESEVRGFQIILNRINDVNPRIHSSALRLTLQNHCGSNNKLLSPTSSSSVYSTPRRYSNLENKAEIQERIRRLTLIIISLKKLRTNREKVYLLNSNYEDKLLKIKHQIVGDRPTFRDTSPEETKLISKKTKQYYFCLFCFKDFKSKSGLNNHTKVHTSEKPSFFCAHCPATFYNRGSCKYHVKSHMNERSQYCHKCSEIFKNSAALQTHVREIHNLKRYRCRFCTRRFRTKFISERHELIYHDGLSHLCRTCSKKFSSNIALIMHKKKYCNNSSYQFKRNNESENVFPGQLSNSCCIRIPRVNDELSYLIKGQSINEQNLSMDSCCKSISTNVDQIDETVLHKCEMTSTDQYRAVKAVKLTRIDDMIGQRFRASQSINLKTLSVYQDQIFRPMWVKLIRVDETSILRKHSSLEVTNPDNVYVLRKLKKLQYRGGASTNENHHYPFCR